MTDSRFKTLMDTMATQIVENSEIEAVYSGFNNETNKALYAEYGVRSIEPVKADVSGTIDQKHEIIYAVRSDNVEDINKALEDMMVLWFDNSTLHTWQTAGGLQIMPGMIEYAIPEANVSQKLGTITFKFTMRSSY